MADTNRPLTDKVALVTGGSRGIGEAVCNRLAEGGAHIILTYLSSTDRSQRVAEACKSHQVKAEALQVDNSDIEAGKRLVEGVVMLRRPCRQRTGPTCPRSRGCYSPTRSWRLCLSRMLDQLSNVFQAGPAKAKPSTENSLATARANADRILNIADSAFEQIRSEDSREHVFRHRQRGGQ